jgi:phage minor structural protein
MGGDSVSYPILYESNATDCFSLGLGPIKTATEAFVIEERNGSFILEGKVFVDDEIYPLLQENCIIKADASPTLTDQRFRIKRIVPSHEGKAEIYAEHVSYLSQELPMKPEVHVSGNATSALNAWKSAILDDNPFVVDSDIGTSNKTSWRIDKVENPRQALGGVEGSILDVWGGEYRFDNYHISLLKKRGTTANTVLAYGRNITDFEQERNIMTTYTTVYPYAIYTDDNENEQMVTIDGYVVDCENVADYPNRNVLPVDFSHEFEHDEVPTKAKLLKLAQDYIKNNEIGIPKTSIKVSFVDLAQTADYADIAMLETVELCDDVRVHYQKLGVDTTAKVIRTKWNVLRGAYDEIEIGEKRTTLSTIIGDTQTAIKEIETSTGTAIIAANGKNMIFHGLFGENGEGEPTATRIGDMWYKPNGEDTEFYIWNGTVWEFIMSTAKFDEIDKKVEELETETAQALENANTAVDQANQAVAKVDSLDKAVNVALEQSTNAIEQAQQAIKDANNLLTTVTEVQGTITDISAVVDEVNNQLAVKVSQTDFDKLKGTVDTQAVQISANEKQIALKASQTSVDTITNNVTDIQSELKTQAGSITAINTRVDGQQTQIGVLESSYSGLSSTIANVQNDFDNLSIGGRNYIKNSQFKNGLNDWISTPNLKSKVSSPFIEMTSSVISDYIGIQQVFNISLKAGDIITVSLDAYNLSSDSNGLQVGVHWRDNTGIIAQSWADVNNKSTTRVALTSSTKRYSFSYRVPPGVNTTSVNLMIYGARGLSFNIAVGNIKLEKGNKATDWSPAPEELATVTEMSNITQTVKDIQLSVADKVSQAQFTILSNQVTTTVSKIDNMEVGGRNWIKNSESPKFVGYQGAVISYVEKQAVPEWNATNAVKHTVTGGTAGRIAAVLGSGVQTYLNKGVDYVHSIYVKNVGKTNVTINNNLGQTVTVAPNESKRVVIHGKSNPTQNQAMQFVLYRDVQTDTLEFIIWHAQIEEATVVSAWKPALETLATFSQITQLSDAINLRVQKNDVVNQINISTEGILIAGKKIQITGETYIANAVIKTANIADLAITNAKIANATIASAKIISIDASKVTASTLSSIVSNTGNLNVSGTLTMSTDNSGITGTFNAGDRWGESYNPRWFQGSYTVGRRFIKFLSNVHELTTADAQGSFLHYSESYFGGDYFKLRSYATKNSTSTLKGRIDMTGAGGIEVSDSWGSVSPKATISPDGSASFAGGVYSPTHVTTGRIIPNLSYQTFQINEGKLNGMHTLSMSATPNVNITANQTKAASMAIGTDNNPRVWFASGVYNRTYASTANMIVTDQGTIGRVTSASKYKLAISEVPDALDLGYKLLTVSPKMWYDKTEIELLSEEITTGKSQSGDTLLARSHYGLIAEDLRAAGLDNYISINQTTKEIEGIEYDRLWTALIPVIKDLVERKVMNEIRLNKLERIMEELRNG